MAGEARFSREMAAARGLNGDPAQARRDSPDPGRRHDGHDGDVMMEPARQLRMTKHSPSPQPRLHRLQTQTASTAKLGFIYQVFWDEY